ncbi:low molecular weight protein arginine phosphatase [Sporosarcina pasteurii]|uniref:Low molecular weight protein-tyrosine-phosphatase ywlE n=1 Tax=Sporosarcina pasteurii TaxID=1474 RepID=A0A380BEV2_SPOPA|nr:low molecular weight protein arginine phosphatase [Sporosarcina pasteurii]MDS9472282.1 low molecular weight protein arginine phosphatase [Sporosarcina pasteurii]QBQ06263.1 low molecular weight protein arginine phosphatase [Sporosarcina pasteurii]SUI99096.1 Low molecular weight protein-tyrosine-phosphatase ywlE [Sporosarcina pasteurii]
MNIYLICTGNTCRSPMAEAILRSKNMKNVHVRSAGIHAMDGIPIAENAKTLIERADMPYTATSKSVTADDVAWADFILTMTDAHKRMLRTFFPDEINKIHTLKGFLELGGNEDVYDPFGGNLDTYDQTFTELSKLMEVLERKLTRG